MQQLTPAAEQLVFNLAERYRVSTDAVRALLVAVINGGGTMAQFYHPELGGNGQWMRGGMTMVGDMFNYGLQGTVSGICSEISNFTANNQAYLPPPPPPHGQSQFQGSGFGGFGSYNWWPSDLGSPSSSGGQNDSRYAYFPQARRLAVQHNGHVTVYDTLDHQIGGVQQQQGGPYGSQSFSSQFGTFTVESLPVISGGSQQPNAPAPFNPPDQAVNAWASNNEPSGDVIATLERLGALRDKGIISDQEFQSKKAELLARL
ncbi:MAG: SHOCT domain-containing protein [Polyangiaceae bacterium]